MFYFLFLCYFIISRVWLLLIFGERRIMAKIERRFIPLTPNSFCFWAQSFCSFSNNDDKVHATSNTTTDTSHLHGSPCCVSGRPYSNVQYHEDLPILTFTAFILAFCLNHEKEKKTFNIHAIVCLLVVNPGKVRPLQDLHVTRCAAHSFTDPSLQNQRFWGGIG